MMGTAIGAVVVLTAMILVVMLVGRDELRPVVMGERLVTEFAGGALREVDACLRDLSPVLAAVCEDDRERLSRRFGTAVHDFYWERIGVEEFREVTASLVADGERVRVWF